jgi:hypothetical protein
MTGRPSMWPAGHSSVSTDSRAYDPLLNQRVNVAAKSCPKSTQSVADRPALEPLWLVVGSHMVYMSQTSL